VLTASEGGILGQAVVLVLSSVSLSHLCVTFPLQNSVVSKLEQKTVIFYIQST
jgi:hypothetical protein